MMVTYSRRTTTSCHHYLSLLLLYDTRSISGVDAFCRYTYSKTTTITSSSSSALFLVPDHPKHYGALLFSDSSFDAIFPHEEERNFDDNDNQINGDAVGRQHSVLLPFDGMLRYQEDDNGFLAAAAASIRNVAVIVGQIIVLLSLYCVATTGSGLPSGPFGIVGGLEGISYLVVLGVSVFGSDDNSNKTLQTISRVTIVMGLAVLVSLLLQRGCVPNAKPILDYSDYLPVCNADETPGLFGGRQ